MVANAGFAILQGRLLDRLGQARVLAAASVGFGVATSLLVWSVQADWPIATTYVFAALGGALLPQVGSASGPAGPTCSTSRPTCRRRSRSRRCSTRPSSSSARSSSPCWRPPGTRSRASPSRSSPASPAPWRSPPSGPPSRRRTLESTTAGPRPGMPWRTVIPLAVVCAALGILFGAAEVTTVAFADEHDHKAVVRRAARPVGAGQPQRRRHHRRGPLAARARPSGCAGARSRWPARWSPSTSSTRCR